jgi:hypothetical protein
LPFERRWKKGKNGGENGIPNIPFSVQLNRFSSEPLVSMDYNFFAMRRAAAIVTMRANDACNTLAPLAVLVVEPVLVMEVPVIEVPVVV